jgi:hypothetical protein
MGAALTPAIVRDPSFGLVQYWQPTAINSTVQVKNVNCTVFCQPSNVTWPGGWVGPGGSPLGLDRGAGGKIRFALQGQGTFGQGLSQSYVTTSGQLAVTEVSSASASTFPANALPLAVVTCDGIGRIQQIQDWRPA